MVCNLDNGGSFKGAGWPPYFDEFPGGGGLVSLMI
jgi:hypothetical protein